MGTAILHVAAEMLSDVAAILPSTVRVVGSEASDHQIIVLKIRGDAVEDGHLYAMEVSEQGISRSVSLRSLGPA